MKQVQLVDNRQQIGQLRDTRQHPLGKDIPSKGGSTEAATDKPIESETVEQRNRTRQNINRAIGKMQNRYLVAARQ